MSASFDASEFRVLARDLTAAGPQAEAMAGIAVRKVTQDITATAKQKAPRDPARPPKDPSRRVTGNLRGSINNRGAGSLSRMVVATAEYAAYQEFGTSRMPARPFMGPAADLHIPSFEAAMDQIAGDIL